MKNRPTLLDSLKGIPITIRSPAVVLYANRPKRYIGGIVSVHCPACKEESMHGWQKEFKRMKCPRCGHEWVPPTYERDDIPDEAPTVFCPVHGCGKQMKPTVYEDVTRAQREARYLCECGAYIMLQFALYEE